MNFEINNSKLEQVIFKYLDNKNFVIKETDKDYYFLENEDDKYAQIRIRKSDMDCYVYYELTLEIKSFFSLEAQIVEDILTRYVENTLNIEVSNTNLSVIFSVTVVENTLNIEVSNTLSVKSGSKLVLRIP